MSTGLAETPWHVERIGHDPPGETNVIMLQSGRAEADALCFALPGLESIMEAFLTSAGLVALAEMGDKTQLLAMLLVARFRQPWPIAAGILAATLANHFLAALVGHEVAGLLDALWFRIVVALGFVGMGLWMLVPDKLDEDEAVRAPARAGVLLTTLIAFFLAEIGDKTQIATVALSAHFSNIAAVTAGTTIGMMIANVPVLFLGEALLRRIPLRPLQLGAALLFVLLGLWALGVALNVLPG